MESLFTFTSPPSRCGYLPDREWQLQYEVVGKITPIEYLARLKQGWRRFGFSLFRPACQSCQMCRSIRIPVATFCPNRSQRRAWAMNEGEISLVVDLPTVTRAKLELYDRFHAYQHDVKGWPEHGPKNAEDYAESFVDNPFVTQEWCYYLGDELIGVGYVDQLPEGLSAIYFFHDPEHRHRSLGTFNVLSVIRNAAAWGMPHVYLGYYVAGCRSLEYKSLFQPNQVLGPDGDWHSFLTR